MPPTDRHAPMYVTTLFSPIIPMTVENMPHIESTTDATPFISQTHANIPPLDVKLDSSYHRPEQICRRMKETFRWTSVMPQTDSCKYAPRLMSPPTHTHTRTRTRTHTVNSRCSTVEIMPQRCQNPFDSIYSTDPCQYRTQLTSLP